ncbi:MAG: acyltransferase family protein [Asticcacaulis sp.]|uniref:acyltransferase family protein n=1 Tax=Asticcacaulis sp. TaxID=1872648 RepID=UPI0039E4BB26
MTITTHGKRADIQGMRAIAVLAVLAFHASHALLPGGFAGVDVFFVLSGYLITQVLLRPMEEKRFSIRDFYRRRIRRLYPALFTVLAFTLVMGLAFFPPTLLKELVKSQFFTTLFLSNLAFARETGYFDLQAELKPLLHTWSLGVEEQFYLLFPPILYVLHRWAKRLLWPVLGLLALWSLWFSQTRLAAHPEVAFYFPTSRAFELLIGALCVGIDRHVSLPVLAQRILGIIGLVAIALGFVLINADSPFPGLLALLPCLGAAALLVSPQGWANRWLAVRPLVRVGDISYSLYLWHWPLLVFARFVFPDASWAIVGALVLSVGMAWLSWRYIETPFLKEQPQTRPIPIWAFGGSLMAASIAVCLCVYYADGLPQRFSPTERTYLAATDDYNHDRNRCHMRSDRPLAYADLCVYGAKDVPASYAVWGDSHGAELAKALGERLSAQGASLKSITMSGCRASLPGSKPVCRQHNIDTMAAVKADANMRTVILVGNLHDDDTITRDTIKGMEQSALELQQAGKQVVIIFPIPTFEFDPPSDLALKARSGHAPETVGTSRALYESRRKYILDEFERFTQANNIIAVRPATIFCDTICHVYRPGKGVLYFNAGHLSLTGAGLLADEIQRTLEMQSSD